MLAATKIIEDLRRENADLKAKLADSEAALHRFQHSQQIEGDYVCEAAEKERAARLKAEAACAELRSELVNVVGACPSEETTDPVFWLLVVQIKRLLESTDAGQNVIDFIAAARRLRAILDIRLSVAAQEAIAPYTADVDAADAKLKGGGA